MYITKTLRTNLEVWRNRVANAHYLQVNKQLTFFLQKLESTSIINSILLELQTKATSLEIDPIEQCSDALDSRIHFSLFEAKSFLDETECAIYHYSLLKVLQQDATPICLNSNVIDGSSQPSERPRLFVGQYIDPLVYYIQDKLDEGSSVLYLLEKYKHRCEWFFQEEMRSMYENAPLRKQEEVLDKDLRKFLFDQGIDYPFSQVSSPSGEADIVSLLHTNDPLVLEVKIFDRTKTYGKNRIVDGFRQIVSYANDYNKPIGYLLVFNMDTSEVNIVTSNNNHLPAKISFAGKTYFIIFINIPPLNTTSASARGKLEKITIKEEEITAEAIS